MQNSQKKNKLKTKLWKNGLSWANKIYHTEFINSTHVKSFDKETNRLADIAKTRPDTQLPQSRAGGQGP